MKKWVEHPKSQITFDPILIVISFMYQPIDISFILVSYICYLKTMFQHPWKLQHTYYTTCNQTTNKSTIPPFELNLHAQVCESTYHNLIKHNLPQIDEQVLA